MNFDYQKKQDLYNTNSYTPQTPKELYSPQILDDEYDGDFEEYKFYKGKDINIYRLWINKYSKHITWKDFQAANQHFDINSPAEGQIVKVPKVIAQKEEKKKSTPQTQPKQETKKDVDISKNNFVDKINPKKKPLANKNAKKEEKFFKMKNGKIVLNQENKQNDKYLSKKNQGSGFFTPFLEKKSALIKEALQGGNSELDELMKKNELTTEEIAKARILIEKIKDETKKGDYFEDLQYKVPYYNQNDSKEYPSIGGGMCNLSSMAMGLAVFGIDNPHPDMQYDDALEKIRIDNGYRHRERAGQMDIASHFGMSFDGAGVYGYSKSNEKMGQNKKIDFDRVPFIDVTDLKPSVWQNYFWFKINILPFLREGNAITLGIWDKSPLDNGHITHLVGVEPEGLRVHDPYGKIKSFDSSYSQAWDKNDKKEGTNLDTNKGKLNLWKYEDLAGKEVYLAYLRILKPKS